MSDRGRCRPVLGLAEQIDRDHGDVGGVVGDDQNLRRPGKEIDADAAVELALRLRDIGVAGARPACPRA